MKYKAKIDNPWCKKGEIAPKNMSATYDCLGDGDVFCINLNPSDFPDLFEPVEEKSDAELFISWCQERAFRCSRRFPSTNDIGYDLATSLLSQGAINPEFLKRLRGE